MIVQFHTPQGIVQVDTSTVTDAKLAEINMDRQGLNYFLSSQPRDLVKEIDKLNAKLKLAGIG